MVVFGVPLALNPADPPSRKHDFPSWAAALAHCEQRRLAWGTTDLPFEDVLQSHPTPQVVPFVGSRARICSHVFVCELQ